MNTFETLQLFAWRLYNADRVSDVNINAQRTPVAIVTDENQNFSMKQAYADYEGNEPVIIFNKDNLSGNEVLLKHFLRMMTGCPAQKSGQFLPLYNHYNYKFP